MHCEIIRDLLPLYIDECCSEESSALVADHLKSCTDCRGIYEKMSCSCRSRSADPKEISLHSISSWKASLLQSLMLFLSFAVMTLGVILEGSTPAGATNGLWAAVLIIPGAGYLLSLASWFFVRVYVNRKAFSNGCCIATLVITALGYLWAALHYSGRVDLSSPLVWCGLGLTGVFCVLSRVLSGRYALLLGRE